jgi:hypothetical protein
MIDITRRLVIEGYFPEEVFSMLARPDVLAQLLPRLRKFEIAERRDNQARLALSIAIGKRFGTVRFSGGLRWNEPHEILFLVRDPLPADVRWSIDPLQVGTRIQVDVSLDLKPWLGPMIHIVPKPIVREMVGSELEHALEKIATQLRAEAKPQVCPFPEVCLLQQTRQPDRLAYFGASLIDE